MSYSLISSRNFSCIYNTSNDFFLCYKSVFALRQLYGRPGRKGEITSSPILKFINATLIQFLVAIVGKLAADGLL